MEQILRSEEMAEIAKQAFSYENQVVYFPVRHHSPACSYHLEKVIAEYQPTCILIEGPMGANEMLDVMTSEETQAPFAVYYSYKDSKGYVSEKKDEFKCYYPFLDYSPELVAAREGAKRGIETRFFDLPYAEILIASKENKGLRGKEEKNNYNDDYYLARNKFMMRLVDNSGLRCFDEFWEKYFEIDGLTQETDKFMKNVLYYCVLSRLSSAKEELMEDGCLAREAYMYENIENAREKHERILVVTGGFHTYGLMELAQNKELQEKRQKKSNAKKSKVKLHSIPKDCQGVYLMSYSMEATDGLNGYASGMPFPAFYQQIWEGLHKQDTVTENTYDICRNEEMYGKVYRDTILKYLVETGKEVRKKEGYLSTYDEICAFSMTDNLAALRGKKFPGAYELTDSALSSYVKGEYNLSTDFPMQALRKRLTGKQVGKLCQSAKIPPLVQCFEDKCRTFRLKTQESSKNEVTLSIFATKKHRQMSEFFYQMEFLETNFANKLKGPNLRLKKDRNLIREIWSYKWSSQVIAALIDASVYGGTLQEACISLTKKKLREYLDAAGASELLVEMFEMGLSEQLDTAFYRLEELIRKDNDFFSLVKTFKNVIMLDELSTLYQSEMQIGKFIQIIYTKIMYTLPFMAQIKDEDLNEAMEAMKSLYSLMNRPEYESDKEVFVQTLFELLDKDGLNPGLEGCIRGILYGLSQMKASEIADACTGYMAGTREKMLAVANLFRGLFFTARDLLFTGDEFIELIDEFVSRIQDDEFMKLLPQLRLAFSYFTPSEIDEIAKRVTTLYGISKDKFEDMQAVSPQVYTYGRSFEEEILAVLKEKEAL